MLTNSTSTASPVSTNFSSSSKLPIAPGLPWLAPLAGYSNLPFRLVCRQNGAAVACTEMISAKGIFYSLRQGQKPSLLDINSGKGKGTWDLLASSKEDGPLVIQLFGAEDEIMGTAVEAVLEIFAGRDIYFDLNMGCSVPKVVKTACGSAMLKDAKNALKVAAAMLGAAGEGRVGFKLRLGWEAGEDVYLSIAKELEQLGAGWITLHPRYARQGYSGKANWQTIATLKQHLSIPVIASGDLFSAKDGVDCLRQTGADGVMFARGAMNNPFIFGEFRQLWAKGEIVAPRPEQLVKLIRQHIDLVRQHCDDRYALSQMRGFIPRYVHNFSGVRALRQKLTACQNWQELDMLLLEFLEVSVLES